MKSSSDANAMFNDNAEKDLVTWKEEGMGPFCAKAEKFPGVDKSPRPGYYPGRTSRKD